MKKYNVHLIEEAKDDFNQFDNSQKIKVAKQLKSLETNPLKARRRTAQSAVRFLIRGTLPKYGFDWIKPLRGISYRMPAYDGGDIFCSASFLLSHFE